MIYAPLPNRFPSLGVGGWRPGSGQSMKHSMSWGIYHSDDLMHWFHFMQRIVLRTLCLYNELEICLRGGIWTVPSHSPKLIASQTRYQSAKGELAPSQGQRRPFELEGYVIRERCHGNLLWAFAHLTVLTCKLAQANPATLTPPLTSPPF